MNKITQEFIEEEIKKIANRKCPICLKELEIINTITFGDSAKYVFQCGHGHIAVKSPPDTVTVRDTLLKAKMNDVCYSKKKNPRYEPFQGDDIRKCGELGTAST